jgi:hypothetical protein
MAGQPFWSPTDASLGANPWDVVRLVASSVRSSGAAAPQRISYVGADSLLPTPGIAGQTITLPGISEISAPKKDIRTNVLVAPGRDNAPVYYLGANPAGFDITFTVWTPDQWDMMQRVLDAIYIAPHKGDPLLSYRVSNPIVAARKIDKVIITSLEGPFLGKFPGGSWAVKLVCLEYAPPPKVVPPLPSSISTSPNAVTGYAGGPTPAAAGAVANPPSKATPPKP